MGINKFLSPLIITMLFINGFSCNTTEPPPPPDNGTITLSLEETSCTEAWVNIKTNGVSLPVNVNFINNDTTVARVTNLGSADTTVYISSLAPNKTYNIQAIIQSTNQSQVTSNKLAVQTLDTTSNNFTWQTYTFGDPNAGSSHLSDVAIINENDIWAVGEIYKNDSTGNPDPNPYNVAHWNGNKWELKKIAVEYKGNQTIVSLYGILILPNGEIIFSSGLPYLPNGNNNWQLYHLWDMGVLDSNDGPVYHIWGTSLDNLYFVGDKGTIVHYNGSSWQKIESGVDLQFLDIYGALDQQTGDEQILAVCTQNYPGDRGIFSITGNTATSLSYYPIQYELFGIWFVPNRHYYLVGGAGIYEKRKLSEDAWQRSPLDISRYGTTKVRGNGLNDIFIVGAYGEFLHFNGERTTSFINNTGLANGSYAGLSIKSNLVVAVGGNNARGVITIGRG